MSAKMVGKWVAGSRSGRSLGINDRLKVMALQRRSGLTAESISLPRVVWSGAEAQSTALVPCWTGLAWHGLWARRP